MNISKISGIFPFIKAKRLKKLIAYIQQAVEKGIITSPEYDQIYQLADHIPLTKSEVHVMVEREFRNHFKSLLQKYASNGEINEEERKALATRAKMIGVSDNDMQLMIDEALNDYKKELQTKLCSTWGGVATIATIGVAAVLAAAAIDKSDLTDDNQED